MLTQAEVQHIAKLAKLNLSQQEIEKYQAQLGEILNYVDKLKEVDTKNVATADGGTRDVENIWREDESKNINNFDLIKGQIKVKKIL